MNDSLELRLAPVDPTGFQIRFAPPHQLVDRVTAERDLFLIAHLGVARVDVASWRLAIGGLVERPRELSFDDIRRLAKRTVELFHQCAGDPRNHRDAKRLVGNVVWGGVDLSELLTSAGVRPAAKYLWAYGLDSGAYEGLGGGNFQKDMPLERLAQGDVLLAYEINGAPLPPERGYPLRLIVPGYYGTNDVKWLCRLELADRRAGGVFTTTLYNDPDDEAPGKTRPVWEAPPNPPSCRRPPRRCCRASRSRFGAGRGRRAGSRGSRSARMAARAGRRRRWSRGSNGPGSVSRLPGRRPRGAISCFRPAPSTAPVRPKN